MQPAFSCAPEKCHAAPRLTIDSGVFVPRRAEMQARLDHNLVSMVWRNTQTWSYACARANRVAMGHSLRESVRLLCGCFQKWNTR